MCHSWKGETVNTQASFPSRGLLRSIFLIVVVAALFSVPVRVSQAAATRFVGPTKSGPLALSADDSLLAVANTDNNSVTLFVVSADANQKLAEIPVGKEPNGVAVSPDGSKVYVTNTIDGTVSILAVKRTDNPPASVIATLNVGT